MGMDWTEGLSEYELKLYDEWVAKHEYETYRSKTTVCIIVLHSGFEIVGTAGCEDPSKFVEHLGHRYALKDALRKLGEFTAFYRAQQHYALSKTEIRASKVFTPDQIEQVKAIFRSEQAKISADIKLNPIDIKINPTLPYMTDSITSTTVKGTNVNRNI